MDVFLLLLEGFKINNLIEIGRLGWGPSRFFHLLGVLFAPNPSFSPKSDSQAL